MDELNQKRLERGEPLSTVGKDEEQLNEMCTKAVQYAGYDGRQYTGPRSNPVGKYRQSTWLPFGKFYEYEIPCDVGKILGYTLVVSQKCGDEHLLYFDADQDRGGCPRRLDVFEGQVIELCRSDILEDEELAGLSKFRLMEGRTLTRVEAFRDGSLAMHFGDKKVVLKWDSPLKVDDHIPQNMCPHGRRAHYDMPYVAFVDDGKQ